MAANIPVDRCQAPVATGPAEPDHAELIAAVLADEAAAVGQGGRIYKRACTHAMVLTVVRPNWLVLAIILTEATVKNGSGMYDIYRTIAQGYGSMAAQKMKPEESYAVAAYIRNEFCRKTRPSIYSR